jgi:hypothetical protein
MLPWKAPMKKASVVMFPIADTWLCVLMFPTALTEPDAVILDAATAPTRLAPVMLPAEVNAPPVTVPNALINPPVRMFPTSMLPVALIAPVVLTLPALTLPLTDSAVKVPTLVILACTALVTLPAVLAKTGTALPKTAKFVSSSLNGMLPV